MTMSSGLLASRPRCAHHGLILDDAGRCTRCVREEESRSTRSVLGRAVTLALVVIGVLLAYRVGTAAYEVISLRASTPAAAPVPPATNGSRVVVYTTGSCPACRLAKKWMGQHGVVYEERRVDVDETAHKELASLGKGVVVPTFVVDEQVLTGFDVNGVRLTEALKSHGIQ